MVRVRLTLVVISLCQAVAGADDKPKPAEDPIAAELNKAKQKYQSSTQKAGEKLLDALADQQKKVEGNAVLKVDQQVRLLEQLRIDRKAFEIDPSNLPKSAGAALKKAVGDYQTSSSGARKSCEVAFDKAAEAHRARKDFAAAKAVLDEKKMHFLPPAARAFVGSYIWFGGGITVIIAADRTALTSNGIAGSWVVNEKQECVLSWRNGLVNFMRVDGDGPNLIEDGKGRVTRQK